MSALAQPAPKPAPKAIRREIAFSFDAEKLGQALAFFADRVSDLSKLKAAKLLYFADKTHLLDYGRPIVGDKYYCLDYGPVPTATLNILNDMISPVTITINGKPLDRPIKSIVSNWVFVTRQSKHPRLEARKKALDGLTKSEEEALQGTVDRYGKFSASKLIDLTHKELPWIRSNECRPDGSSVEIPWEYFIDEAGDAADAVAESAIEREENRDFFLALQK